MSSEKRYGEEISYGIWGNFLFYWYKKRKILKILYNKIKIEIFFLNLSHIVRVSPNFSKIKIICKKNLFSVFSLFISNNQFNGLRFQPQEEEGLKFSPIISIRSIPLFKYYLPFQKPHRHHEVEKTLNPLRYRPKKFRWG